MGPLGQLARGTDAGRSPILRKAAVASEAVLVGARKPADTAPAEDAPPDASAAEREAMDRAAQLEAVREQARAQGYAEGFASGDEEAKGALAARRAALEGLFASVEEAHQAALA